MEMVLLELNIKLEMVLEMVLELDQELEMVGDGQETRIERFFVLLVWDTYRRVG